ncbi:hypothetical protein [Methylobacterium sp. Leaf106]|uniref:hypothetical protein n=1 Tax=Methylobacterium sp. Leaf106 TaxID=1736255 RepID=UPI0006F5E237|nr:hypothetical protein [Methylobacterium sp. Leaf106]KQP40477.1 hypothetical protein ASF34_11810 [Methylobacterium sp. Leaf106]
MWSITGEVAHPILSLSLQERGSAHPVRCLNIVALRQGGIVDVQGEMLTEMLGDQPAECAEADDPNGNAQ